jgi:hypothetical protein
LNYSMSFTILTMMETTFSTILTFSKQQSKSISILRNYWMNRSSTMKKSMKSASTFMIRWDCVSLLTHLATQSPFFIWETLILYFSKSTKTIMWFMWMMAPLINSEIMSWSICWKTKSLWKNIKL